MPNFRWQILTICFSSTLHPLQGQRICLSRGKIYVDAITECTLSNDDVLPNHPCITHRHSLVLPCLQESPQENPHVPPTSGFTLRIAAIVR